ncbi:MAG: protoheme IX farnesyltransferase, partial [Myxococcales bacterium]|nr:protoheme IX farnesyltransferase [Myxococcales bacterium]
MTTKTHVPVLEQPLGLGQIVRDMVALTKPRITFMVAVTAAAGMWVAPGAMQPVDVVVALGALALVVGSANSFNCWLERDLDRLMARTKGRPLPAGRLSPGTAFTLAMMLMSVAVPLMMLAVNPLSGMLAVAALGIYVAVYTPLKTMTPAALIVGAVPGALPPLIG